MVDPATMPDWLRAFVEVNPVSLMTTAVRGLMSGEQTADLIASQPKQVLPWDTFDGTSNSSAKPKHRRRTQTIHLLPKTPTLKI